MLLSSRQLFNTIYKYGGTCLPSRLIHNAKRNNLYRDISLEFLDGSKTGVVVMSMNKSATKNSLDNDLVDNFLSVIDDIRCDERSRVVVLRSLVPRVFCAGANLKERIKMTEKEVQRFISRLHNFTMVLANLPVPVIAAIDGVALGGGLEIALACDLRIASDNAKLGLVETKLAIIPGAGGTQRLPRLIGPALAKELIFTGRIFDGTEAHGLGVVNHVVPQNATGDASYIKAVEIAKEILPNGPIGVEMAKLAINRGLEVDIDTGYVIEENCYGQLIPTKDRVEGLTAFSEKRKPMYKGE